MKGCPQTDAFAIQTETDLKGKEVFIDWKRMFPVLIDNKIERIFEALGWDRDGKQMGLGDFE